MEREGHVEGLLSFSPLDNKSRLNFWRMVKGSSVSDDESSQ